MKMKLDELTPWLVAAVRELHAFSRARTAHPARESRVALLLRGDRLDDVDDLWGSASSVLSGGQSHTCVTGWQCIDPIARPICAG